MSEAVTRAVEALKTAVDAEPAQAKVVFRAATVSASDSLATQSRIRGFTVALDEPPDLGGTDTAPNPVEAVLAALGSCQAIVYRAYASVLGLRLHRVEVDVKGHLDLRGFLDAGPAPAGFERVTFTTRVVSPEAPERIRELARLVQEHCPVLDTLQRAIDVSGSVEVVRSEAPREAA